MNYCIGYCTKSRVRMAHLPIWGPQNLGSGALLHGALTIHPPSQFLHHTFQHAKISTMGHLLDA